MGASDDDARKDRDDEVRFGAFARAIADREKIKSTILLCCSKLQAALPNRDQRTWFCSCYPGQLRSQHLCSTLSPIKHCKSKLRGEQAKQGSKWKTDDGGITILDGFCRRAADKNAKQLLKFLLPFPLTLSSLSLQCHAPCVVPEGYSRLTVNDRRLVASNVSTPPLDDNCLPGISLWYDTCHARGWPGPSPFIPAKQGGIYRSKESLAFSLARVPGPYPLMLSSRVGSGCTRTSMYVDLPPPFPFSIAQLKRRLCALFLELPTPFDSDRTRPRGAG